MLLNKEMEVIKDILSHLQDEELCDVKIIGTDGEIPANKTILIMRLMCVFIRPFSCVQL